MDMDVSMLSGVRPDYMDVVTEHTLLSTKSTDSESFSSVLASAMNLLNETNELQHDAESEEMKFALGLADNPHDMQIAASKALSALQYTTAIRDKLQEAYKELMNMQV